MRVLLDANIFISYLLNPQKPGSLHDIMTAVFNQDFVLLLPAALLDEFIRKIPNKPYLAERIHPDELQTFVDLLSEIGAIVPAIEEEIPAVTRDPKDDYLLAYAMVGAADYLVTGDEDLLVLEQVEGLTMISPKEFVFLLRRK